MTNEREELQRISDLYAAFAIDEARGWSARYERLALAVAGSRDLLALIATLPADRRQPNLFLAAVRRVRGVPESADHLAAIVRDEPARIRAVMLSRTTQTNEPARCAVLLPVLGRLPPPLALLEVGASAGLCLLPDRYGYDYGVARIEPPACTSGSKPPVFACEVAGALPVPSALPQIAWRCGLDLNPLDLHSPDDVQWLETFVWPEQEERAQQLRAAIEIGRREPPRIVKGDLLTDLEPLIAAAPPRATLASTTPPSSATCHRKPRATGSPRRCATPMRSGSATRLRACSRRSPRPHLLRRGVVSSWPSTGGRWRGPGRTGSR